MPGCSNEEVMYVVIRWKLGIDHDTEMIMNVISTPQKITNILITKKDVCES